MKLWYKIRYGFTDERELPIEQDELEKAIAVFLTDGKGVFRSGAIRGSQIQAIIPDWHKTMGWTQGYKLSTDDFNEIRAKGIDTLSRDYQVVTEQRVKYLIETKQQHLIGTGTGVPQIEAQRTEKVLHIGESLRKHEEK